MAINIKPLSFSDGDPVTASQLRDLVSNIETVAKGEVTQVAESVAKTAAVSGSTINVGNISVGGSVKVSLSKTPQPVTFDYSSAGFTSAPMVVACLAITTTGSLLNYPYLVVVSSTSKTSASGWVYPATSTAKTGTAHVRWIATGTPAATA